MFKPEQKTQKSLEGFVITRENMLNHFGRHRIEAEPSFAQLYSTYQNDQERTHNKRLQFEQSANPDQDGPLAEALVFYCIEKGALGSQITTRGTSLYDDYFHGADMVVESKKRQMRDPIVSSVDVTISAAPDADDFKKFDKKVERVKSHIDFLASFSERDAINISAWMQSGGLSQPRTKENQFMFDQVEKLMLLKYYKTPTTSEEPDRPHFVTAAPQIVTAIDKTFINKVFQGGNQEKSIRDISALLQVEIPFSVATLKQYLESLKRKGRGNVFLDNNLVACAAWEITFNDEVYQTRIKNALQECIRDPQLRQQIQQYQQTVSRILR